MKFVIKTNQNIDSVLDEFIKLAKEGMKEVEEKMKMFKGLENFRAEDMKLGYKKEGEDYIFIVVSPADAFPLPGFIWNRQVEKARKNLEGYLRAKGVEAKVEVAK